MKYNNVYIQGYGYELPPHAITTNTLENQLSPAYKKMGMVVGQLEKLTGLRERRFWDVSTIPSDVSVLAVEKALKHSGIKKDQIGALVNCSVCRDQLEPSTATVIAKKANLAKSATLFDVSNACLGFATGLSVVANMIELGQIEAGIVVSSELASEIVENTVRRILEDPTEAMFLGSIPSLTLGSAAVAYVLTKKDLNTTGLKFDGGTTLNDADQTDLCVWGPDTGFPSKIDHSMFTDGKTLLETGTRLAHQTWDAFSKEQNVKQDDIDVSFCHQVGPIHSALVFDALKFDMTKDFATYEYLGNTGSAAIPITAIMGTEQGKFVPGKRAIMMGIGSGLVCSMYSLTWEN
ncbi:MAG: 3-oxoacyl-ACP synthase III [Candidatus Cloacimonetes bacterium]|nr:3-oxoacyl-ACP synthase III [Candidatus Cloacimonadota bacterium]